MRKIIQIVAGGNDATLFALCDDGSVWRQEFPGLYPITWARETDIPQDGVD